MSFVAVVLSFGSTALGLLHLASHALFKSLMLISLGKLRQQSNSAQLSNSCKARSSRRASLLRLRVLALVGLAAMVGFLSKQLAMEFMDEA